MPRVSVPEEYPHHALGYVWFGMRGASRPLSEIDAGAEYMRRYFSMQFALHPSRPLEVSNERPTDFYHLYYDTLLADPLAELRRVYGCWATTGMPPPSPGCTPGCQATRRTSMVATSIPSKIGLTRDDMTPYFADYLRAHPVARSDRSWPVIL